MRLLFTSAGRRSYLLRWFREALTPGESVIGTDMSPLAPALRYADEAHEVPAITSPRYVDTILRICEERKVTALVPLNDLDLVVLSERRADFESLGVVPLLPDHRDALICADKLQTAQTLTAVGIPCVATYPGEEDPADEYRSYVVKPRFGSGSLAIEMVDSADEVGPAVKRVHAAAQRSYLRDLQVQGATDVVVQPLISGPEYGMDVVNSLDQHLVAVGVRRKLSMRQGETFSALTVKPTPEARALAEALSELINHMGVMDVDLLSDGETSRVLELNPRFGGGYPFSHVAGMNAVAALVAWLRGEERAAVSEPAPGVRARKVFTEEGVELEQYEWEEPK